MDSGGELFNDRLLGPHEQVPSQWGDPLIRDRHANWSYQFCVVVDDFLQDIDLVVRGRDLLSSTGLQIRLARMLGRPASAHFAHHPLIMRNADQKLSKSDGDTGVRDLRAEGWSSEQVIGAAAHRVGLIDEARPLSPSAARALFETVNVRT
jgi:glutamyl-tRNA synthetase/glutamyl-Q tRNA(Asp) synthetase